MKFIKVLFFTIGCYVIFSSNNDGRTTGTTGAPGESSDNVTCNNCHIRGSFNPIAQVEIKNLSGQVVSSILPNTDYVVNMKVGDLTAKAKTYGFQLVPLRQSNNTMAGTWGTLGTKVKRVNTLNRQYLTHSSPNAIPLFTANWKSPNVVGDSIVFYYGAVATDGANSALGDNAIVSRQAFRIDVASGAEDVQNLDANIQPTLAHDAIWISATEQISSYSIYNQIGQLLKSDIVGTQSFIDVSNLSAGTYFIKLEGEKNKSTTKKFIKI